jgi:MOSC domain-containing protein YiiM
MVEVDALECIAGRGLVGDRYFDRKPDYKGQITFFAWETHQDVCRQLNTPDRPPWIYRRNVITRGIDLNAWIGVEFELQGVRFVGTEEARPCYWMNTAVGPGAEDLLQGRGGLRARILNSGTLRRTATAPA